MVAIPTAQVPGIYHRRIGDVVITALSDGYLDVPYSSIATMAPDEAEAMLLGNGQPAPPRVSINCFLVRSGGRTAIIDTGSGDTMGPTLGRLPEMLAAIGVSRSDIDTVLLTHMHPDHSNGLTSANGKRLFPEAQIVVGAADIRHWHDDAAMARVNESQQVRYFKGARFMAAPYMDRMRDAVGEVFPGVTAIPMAGHTPGHSGFLIESGGETLLIWGDICHLPGIQLPRPDITMVYDSDPNAAAATRKRVLDWVATDKLLVAGIHLHFPGLVHIVKQGTGYAAVPEAWAFTL
jgi:glyoxylase-like metal-dependent hydrolase (beta-lactamase superfamily II)